MPLDCQGIAWTSPLFVRVGSTLTVPASVVLVDIAWRGQPGSWSRLVGAAYVVAGFALLGLPNRAPNKRSPAHRVVSDTGLAAVIAGGALAIGICAWDK